MRTDATHRFSLRGRRALITGAGMGIGRAIAVAFAEAGASVVLHYHGSAVAAVDTAVDLRARGHHVHTLGADLLNVDETR